MKSVLTAFSACFLLSGCLVVVPVPVGQDVSRSVPATVETTGFGGMLNELRQSRGLTPLGQDPRLQRAAQVHADHMVQEGYFAHQSPGGPLGDNMAARIRGAGCNAGAAAENIAFGQQSERAVLDAWIGSQGHLTNMVGPRYRAYGLGRAGDTWVLKLADGC
jgi:uncharacterized protein YkwD